MNYTIYQEIEHSLPSFLKMHATRKLNVSNIWSIFFEIRYLCNNNNNNNKCCCNNKWSYSVL